MSTYNHPDEIALYMDNNGDDGLTSVQLCEDGTYYCYNDKFDFGAETLIELKAKLEKYEYTLISGELH